jgi:hypothetical protein
VSQSWQCGWCLNTFTRERRSLAEVEALRRVLLIEMTTPFDPPICDGCYYSVMASAVPEARVQGSSAPNTSLGFPNLVMK